MKYWIVDVFGREKYSGNQLAVVLVDRELGTGEMQRIAQEFHFSETSFILADGLTASEASRAKAGQAAAAVPRYKVRIFTPESEVPFAGHPTLGTAYIIRTELAEEMPQRIELDLPAGVIPVDFDDKAGLQWMQQIEPEFGTQHDPASVAALIGLEADDILTDYPVQNVSTGLEFMIIPVRSLEKVRAARADSKAIAAYFSNTAIMPILLFCPESYEKENSVNCRMFADLLGVPEDPATGSANGCLAAYLFRYSFLGTNALDIRSEQGYEINRKSILHLRAAEENGRINVHVGGQVFLVAEGRLL